ncbi:MAG: DUF192 domain-containing protein [Gemmatimonadetes bacterium]|nr:DUF192 domain-containing protein [Gemmatimonadota bacterium]
MLGSRIRLADDLLSRLRGFMFRNGPAAGEGILLSPCQAVHMFGVSFPLDIVFIDEGGRVVSLYPGLEPRRWTPLHRTASHALELPAGMIDRTRTEVGDALFWTPAGDDLEANPLPDAERNGDGTQNAARKPA